jgi:catechol 2,3-dioxygenase-like lactoylglutathione lyase family enzyme
MKRLVLAFAILLFCVATSASDPPKRPRIFGIVYVCVLVTDVDKARDFYSLVLNAVPLPADLQTPCDWCERAPAGVGMSGRRLGPIELELSQAQGSPSLLKEVAFSTDDAKKLRDFLLKNHVAAEKLTKCGVAPCFSTLDPENHRLIFVQRADYPTIEIPIPGAYPSSPVSSPIIHAGFVVQDRAAEDHFYKDILGFRPYWHGGMKDGQDDWVSMQVPDGTDWLEFMVNVSPDADQRLRGIMNHIAIGVTDIQAAKAQLIKNGANLTEEPKVGRDGKNSIDIYDPDLSRVEIMDFAPTKTPCCHAYTADHPKL